MQLESVDSILDPEVNDYIDSYIDELLKERGFEPKAGDIPLDLTYQLELDAISLMVASYEGLPVLAQTMAQWCVGLQQALGESNSDHFAAQDYIVEAMSRVLIREFRPEPFNALLRNPLTSWSPPAYYWELLKSDIVVDSIKKIYKRHPSSEFISAFLQDFCETSYATGKKVRLSDITAHFNIFIKAFRELLVGYLKADEDCIAEELEQRSSDDSYVQHHGRSTPLAYYEREIVKLLCHAENSFIYGQALLHFLPYHDPHFITCKRLSQLCYRYLIKEKGELRCANKMLLCTPVYNYPQLATALQVLESTSANDLTATSLINISKPLQRILRRFRKHKTLLLFYDTKVMPEPVDSCPGFNGEPDTKEGPIDSIHDAKDDSSHLKLDDPWESDMLSQNKEDWENEQSTRLLISGEVNTMTPSEIIEKVDWPTESEMRQKKPLDVFWNLPSASQAGDDELIEDDLQDERDRRGQTKLNLPPMDSLRETLIVENLWSLLVCSEAKNAIQSKDQAIRVIELLLVLTVYCEYELVVMHLQNEEQNNRDEDLNVLEKDFYDCYGAVDSGDVEFEFDVYNNAEFDFLLDHSMAMASSDTEEGEVIPQSWGPYGRSCRGARRNSLPASIRGAGKTLQVPPKSVPQVSTGGGGGGSVTSSFMGRSSVPSVIQSSIYKDPHEGSKLRAFQPSDTDQATRLTSMFDAASRRIDEYKIYEVIRDTKHDPLSDYTLARLLEQCKSGSGASATLKRLEWLLLDGGYDESSDRDPVESVNASVLCVMIRISIHHPRKRQRVLKILHRLLQASFASTIPVTDVLQNRRRRILSSVIVHLGMSDGIRVLHHCDTEALPWRSINNEWALACPPIHRTVLQVLADVVGYFDTTFIRETLECLGILCLPPFSPSFAIRLTPVLYTMICGTPGGIDFNSPVNQHVRPNALRLVHDILGSHAPYNPPPQVLKHCEQMLLRLGG